ncbi:MAG TPA: metal ABC transporter substrate-binding protein [Planctomycetota bacterium]|nr:metal ABC transporter substrate-binding protein [Planctomycetota bacterium]
MKNSMILVLCLSAAASPGAGAPPCSRVQEAGKKKIACTIPAVRSIAAEVAGDDFEVFALSKPDENVHTVSPTPNLMRKVGSAELFIEIGLQLEIWAPEVSNNCGNPRLFPGAPGHIVVSAGISREEMPVGPLSRSQGDVHPEGNPHIWIDPLRAVRMAENIAAALKKVSPEKTAALDARLEAFRGRIDDALFGPELVKLVGSKKLGRLAQEGKLWTFLQETEADGAKLSTRIGGWLKKAEPLRGESVIEFHRTWIYFAKLFGFEIVGAIEEKPGIDPGPKHLIELVATMKAKKARLIVVENFQESAKPRRVAEESGAVVVTVPAQPGGEEGTEAYVAFIDRVVSKLVDGLKSSGKK